MFTGTVDSQLLWTAYTFH